MGASSSTEAVSKEQREVESQAASTGALPLLQKSFSNLADPLSNSIPLSSLQVPIACLILQSSSDFTRLYSFSIISIIRSIVFAVLLQFIVLVP